MLSIPGGAPLLSSGKFLRLQDCQWWWCWMKISEGPGILCSFFQSNCLWTLWWLCPPRLKGTPSKDRSWPACRLYGGSTNIYATEVIFYVFKFHLLRLQPYWFTVCQWRAEKGWLLTWCTLHLTCRPCSWHHSLTPNFIALQPFVCCHFETLVFTQLDPELIQKLHAVWPDCGK